MKKISGKDNPTVKHITKLMKSSTYRKEQSSYIIEGIRLCTDALESHAEIQTVVFSEKLTQINPKLMQSFVEVCESTLIFSDKLFSQISDTKTPQGILCIVKRTERKFSFEKNSIYLGLEHIQDPSNIGTILRTAEALGIKGVIITKDSCDIFSPKVIRGTMGAIFRLPIYECQNMAHEVQKMNENQITTIATTLHQKSIPITAITEQQKQSCAVIIGNEGNGLTPQTIDECQIKAVIPMQGKAESFNVSVATAIILWELCRTK
ncbi:MAG: RNA methyltransferase [Clostridia bacterium]|nr:RNA methyltransferase [Clostridia bacterium]